MGINKNEIVDSVFQNIISKHNYYEVLKTDILDAYNNFQNEKRFGVDYIFNLKNNEDIICILQTGLSVQRIYELISSARFESTPFFFYGENHSELKLLTRKQFISQMEGYFYEIIMNVLENPFYGSNKNFYEKYISPLFQE